MFPRFLSPASVRGPELRAGRRRRPGYRRLDRSRRRFGLEGLEERCLLSGLSSVTEYSAPQALAGPIAAGPDGNLWFGMGNDELGEINPTTRTIAEYLIGSSRGLTIGGITAGPDGNLWISDHDGTLSTTQIGMFNPTTHTITEFAYHSSSNDGATWGITAGPDGNIWFTDAGANAIGTINTTTHAITEFPLPIANSEPWGITAGPDGNLWFIVQGWARGGVASAIGEINPTTHAITEFPTPTPNSAPTFIAAGSDGNLWFTESSVGQIGEINPTTHAITEFLTPTSGTAPYGIAAGPDGNLWFTEELASGLVGQIGEINPATDAITEFAPPASNSGPDVIAVGSDGNLWFTDIGNNRIGVAAPSGVQLAVTQPAPTTVTAGAPFGLTVDVENNSGALDSSYAGTLTVSLDQDPGGVPLGGTLSEPAVNGVAVFTGLTLDAAGSGYGLAVSGNGLYGTAAGDLTVNAAPASQVVITQQPPASVTAGGGFGLDAEIEDPYGNVVTSATNTVTGAMANDPGGTSLGGTTSATASQGVAALGPLTLTAAASGYTLQVSSKPASPARPPAPSRWSRRRPRNW